MGLTISATSQNYEFEKNGKEYCNCSCGFGSFKKFRDDLIFFYSKGKIKTLDQLLDYDQKRPIFTIIETKEPCIGLGGIEELLKIENNDRLKNYYDFLKSIKSISKDLFNCLPIILHSDGDGKISYETVKMMTPLMENFFKENPDKDYGSDETLSWKEDFLKCLSCVVEKQGELQFA